MAISADTRRQRGASSRQPAWPSRVAGPRAAFGPTLALTVTLAIACFAAVLASVELIVNPAPLPPPFHLGESQNVETTLYLTAFVAILPVALIAVPRIADAIAATPNAAAVSFLAALLAATLAGSILGARLLPGGGVAELLGAVGVWWVAAVALLARARLPRRWAALLALARFAPAVWAFAGAAALAAVLAFASLGSISVLPLAIAGVALPVVLVVYARRSGSPLPARRRWGLAFDAAFAVLLLLAVPDLSIFSPDDPLAAFKTEVSKSHHNFLLGPVNEVLHGRAVLVDTASQYGIGPIYLLAAWFGLVPIGYGTAGFLDGGLFALLFAAGYCLVRLAGTPRLLAAAALALAVVALIYNLVYPVGSLPQHGPLRFGLPVLLILAATVEARWPRRSRAARGMQLAVVGLASVWALEAFALTLFTFAAIVCFRASTDRAPGRLAPLVRRGLAAVAACVAAHLIFMAATLALAGRLPDYGWYLSFLEAFLFGEIGDITYDFSAWSPGLAVGGAYAASAAALVLVVRRRPDLVARERVTLIALAGTTGYGVALLSYLVDRSRDEIVPYVSFPLILAVTLWVTLLLRGAEGASRFARVGGLGFALSLALLLFATAWSSIGERLPRSALGHALPGGDSVRTARHRLWNLPPVDPRASQGEYLLSRYMPADRRVLTIVWPDLETEILIRSDRAHELPLAFPPEDSFVSSHHLPALRRAVAELRPGDRLLTQVAGLEAFAALRAQRFRDPLANLTASQEGLATLQEWVLQQIGDRFDLRAIHRDDQGFVVAALAPRR